jgi:HEPN domain-containing protein
MSGDALVWLQYARENLQVAEMTLRAELLNPCLQNAQQAIEKALKALLISRNTPVKRTHSIRDLNHDLQVAEFETGMTEEDCELLDSIYVSSKYPLDSVLPHSHPDVSIARRCLMLAKHVVALAESTIRA